MLETALGHSTRPDVTQPGVEAPLPTARIIALGGGTGLAVLLQGMRALHFPEEGPNGVKDGRLTAVVTVADDGGSSGDLRRQFNMLAPGDIRNCLLALSDADPTLRALFDFRFDGTVGGHSLGNLMLTALTLLEKDFNRGIERAARLLAVRGQVLPATADDVELEAEYVDGSRRKGESRIAAARRRIQRISLLPPGTRALPQVLEAIAASNLVVIGPGSLYTSLIPVLLVQGMARAIAASGARVVVVMNLMTEPGETDGYSASDMLIALREHAPELPIHDVLLNNTALSTEHVRRYAARGAAPIAADVVRIESLGYRVVGCDLLGDASKARHHPIKLARALLNLAA
ncbi:MAG: gluconeogenesis factor YvcK family protein [Bacillota bacterium]